MQRLWLKNIMKIVSLSMLLTAFAPVCSAMPVHGEYFCNLSYQDQVVYLINQERTARGLEPVYALPILHSAAQIRAEELETSFSHTRPNGTSAFALLNEMGIQRMASAENIAAGFETPQCVVDGWMSSELHRDNILNPGYTYVGIGYDSIYWAQYFIKASGYTDAYLPQVELMPGDLNNDCEINASDAACILSYAASNGAGSGDILSEKQCEAADVDENTVVDSVDAALVLQYAAYCGVVEESEFSTIRDYVASSRS